MLSILLNWLYVTLTVFLIGFWAVKMFEKFFAYQLKRIDEIIVTGMVLVTTYVQAFSLFYKVGFVANLVLCVISLVCLYLYKSEIKQYLQVFAKSKNIFKTIVFFVLLLIVCYFTSRGYEHYDTGLYHAQAIHWIEEYGIIPGLSNLHYRLAYNSSAFSVTALYSFAFMLGRSLHTLSGYFVGILLLAIVGGFRKPTSCKLRISDFIRIAALYYITMTFASLNSPSSDYFALSMVLYILLKYADHLEQGGDLDSSVSYFGWIALIACFAITLKISVAPIILVVILPAYMLLKRKEWKKIAGFVVIGVIMVVPYFTRGVILSGWLLYPSTIIDLFSFDFKIHEDVANADQLAVMLWGRNADYGDTLLVWIPKWFASISSSIEKILVLLDVVAVFSLISVWIYEAVCKKWKLYQLVLDITIVAGLLFWFFSAPLMRYGCAYVLVMAFYGIGRMIQYFSWKWVHKISVIVCILLACYKSVSTIQFITVFASYDNYIWQQDYIRYETREVIVNGITFYEADDTDQMGYYDFPGTITVDECEMKGTTLEEGFIYKPKNS
ncbi:MAG: hypothetical protein R3Y24_02315 [Eubacteriales bacterium]